MTSRSRNRYILAFGSNATADLAFNTQLLKDALRQINASALRVEHVSRFHQTPAFPAGAGPDFVNACAIAEGSVSATEALQILHDVEAEMGRVRTTRWGQRVIDIDLLAMGDAVLPDAPTWQYWRELPLDTQQRIAPDELILPHPRLQDRGFVLVPMADVAPDWVHPMLGKSVSQMLAAIDSEEIGAIKAI